MPFMKKEELQAEAERLGIDISGMKYQEQVAAVSAALRNDSSQIPVANPKPVEEKQVNPEEMKRRRNIEYGRQLLDEVRGRRIIVAPGIRPPENPGVAMTANKYDEELDSEMDVEEISYGLDSLGNPFGDVANNGTFRVVGRSQKKVVGKASIPKENAQIQFTVGEDWFPVIIDSTTGQRGYPFKRYVKPYLIKAGVYEDYRDRFDSKKYPGNCFYISGWSCVDKDLVDWIFEDINRKAREQHERQ